MSVIRVKKHTQKYVVINKYALEDATLSFKAKGLWAYCMSRPDNWEFHVNHLVTVSKEKKRAIYSSIKELIKAGYCKKIQISKGKGKGKGRGCFESVDYEIYEEPMNSNNFSQSCFAHASNALAQNEPLLSKEETNQIPKGIFKEKECLLSAKAEVKKIIEVEEKEEKILSSQEIVKPRESLETQVKIVPDCKKSVNRSFKEDIVTYIDDIFRESVRQRKDWRTTEIIDAFNILYEYKGIVGDPLAFIEGTINNLRQAKKSDFLAKRKGNEQWKKEKKESDNFNEKSSAEDTKAPVLVKFDVTGLPQKYYINGCRIP